MRWRLASDRGSALVVALLLTTLLTALGCSLVLVADLETAISATHRAARQGAYVAEATLECALADLAAQADWRDVLDAAAPLASACVNGAAVPRTRDGSPLDVARMSAEVQTASDALYGPSPSNPDSPRWVLAARCESEMRDAEPATPLPYVLLWVADDAEDGDGDAGSDSNGVVMIRAASFDRGSARSAVEALVARAETGLVRVTAWRRVQ